MFFFRKRSVVFFGRDKILLSAVGHTGKRIPESSREMSCDPETLDAGFSALRKDFPKRIRLVLAEEWLYNVFVMIPKGGEHDSDHVAQAVQEMIPEQLSETVWDYSVVKTPWLKEASGTSVHVRAVRRDFLETVLRSLRSAGFFVESVDAESCILSRMVRSEQTPVIVGYVEEGGRTLLVAAYHGLPIATEMIGPDLSGSADRFLESVKTRTGIAFSSAEFCPRVLPELRETFSAAGVAVSEREFDLCFGAMMKNRIHGKRALLSDVL